MKSFNRANLLLAAIVAGGGLGGHVDIPASYSFVPRASGRKFGRNECRKKGYWFHKVNPAGTKLLRKWGRV